MKTNEEILKGLISLETRVDKIEKTLSKLTTHDSDDVLLQKAIKIVQDYDKVSTSLLQRKLGIGYARAARMLDQLEEKGYVGKGEGAKPRKVIRK